MADLSKVAPFNEAVQDQIHFDTLWANVQQVLALYSGQRWSARGDDDPGITLLQALAFGVSDVSYRHTLPLIDLLTEKNRTGDERYTLEHGESIFAHEFGPEWALTCSPVTLEDYRRAILDLAVPTPDGKQFCFRDVQITTLRAAQGDGYTYTYDAAGYDFRFATTKTTTPFNVAGQYRLWVTPTPGVDPSMARKALTGFLKGHRNLCEWAIESPCFVPVTQHTPKFRLVLEDDLLSEGEAMSRAVAQTLWVMNQTLLPAAKRQGAQARLDLGEKAEQIYQGPRLEHGWIASLPPPRALDKQKNVPVLAAYSTPVYALSSAVTGSVMGIRAVEWEDKSLISVAEESYTQLWVDSAGKLSDITQGAIQLYRHGQLVPTALWAHQDVVEKEYRRLSEVVYRAQSDSVRCVPYGRHRSPGFYRTVGASLPAVYGLQQAAEMVQPQSDAGRLLQFLRPFEQLLANCTDQLKKLPRLLAFDGRDRDAALWGASDWPTKEDDELAYNQRSVVFEKNTVMSLNALLGTQSQDNEKELAIVDHLLGYFGEQRASRALITSHPEVFRHVQQGMLRQVTRLAYERSSISISKVSALQRKIAARLGVGAELFDEVLQKKDAHFPRDPLPFYVIEHRELLPALFQSASQSQEWPQAQVVNSVAVSSDNTILTLRLNDGAAQALRSGMLIELQGKKKTVVSPTSPLEPLAAIVIHEVKQNEVSIQLSQHARLSRSIPLLKDFKAYTWHWRVGRSWLKRVVYDVQFHGPQGIYPADNQETAVLNVGPSFPNDLQPGTRLALRPKGRWLSWPTKSDLTGNGVDKLLDIIVEVVAVDPLQGTVTVKWVSAVLPSIEVPLSIPGKDSPLPVVKPVVLDVKPVTTKTHPWKTCANPTHPYAWSVPYTKDAFAFTLSVVLDRQWLKGSQNPQELSRWITQIVREEMPSHLNLHIHWLDNTDFINFANKYRQWQDEGLPVGDKSYELLRLLGIGERPVDERGGIGFARIVKLNESNNIEKNTSQYSDAKVRDRALQQTSVVYVRGA
ncbi:hypothetical protein ACTVPQ_24970 [Serratia bockelmannii]|uniref:hypothetical protein n=1 Tax=Serratia bockelmannii TaxID=2703793 RepID=UPI003FA72B08